MEVSSNPDAGCHLKKEIPILNGFLISLMGRRT
jgi:hypothetical protein